MNRTVSIAAILLTCSVGCLSPVIGADSEAAPSPNEAVELYDRGKFAEALPLLERLDAEGLADGPMLYRLYYCQRAAGQTAAAGTTLGRATERLEDELAESREIEIPFYLSNAYLNMRRSPDARRVAQEAIRQFEAGELTADDGVAMFQVGRLYADLGREAEATRWQRDAFDRLAGQKGAKSIYLGLAGRYLADRAVDMNNLSAARIEDLSAAEIYLSAVYRHGNPSAQDLDRLGEIRARNQMYGGAARVWKEAIGRNPAQADRARYCSALCSAAARMKELPESTPEGRPLSELTREELDGLLKDQALSVREIRGEIDAARALGELTPSQKKEFRKRLWATRRLFVAAALDYALRGYNIREAAFFGGYAPLVFQPREWKVEVEELGETPPPTSDPEAPAESAID